MDRKLRRAALEQLAAVEEMTIRSGSQLPLPAVRNHLKTITGGWRKLLLAHQPDDKNRCPVCWGWLRRRRWPCQVWMTAYQYLIGEGSTPAADRPGKAFTRAQQPRRVEVISRQVEGIPRQVEGIPYQVNASAAADQSITGRTRPAATDGSTPIHRAAVTGSSPPCSPRDRADPLQVDPTG